MSNRQINRWVRLLIVCNLCLIGIVVAQGIGGGRRQDGMGGAAVSLVEKTAAAQTSGYSNPPDLADAAARVSPAIVSIGAVRTVVGQARMNDFFSPFFIPMEYEERIPYLGSGVIISKDGLVVTNFHVVSGAKDIFVYMADGREVKAQVVDADTVVDVAVLRIDCRDCPTAETGDSDRLRAGQWVLAVGNPFGNLISDPHPTVTVGVVSALNRSFNPEEGRMRVYQGMIQTDAAINPGNSGGALVDSMGRVVGINTFIFTRSGGSEGIGFAIPINRAMRVVDEIHKYGHVRQLRADFEIIDISRRLAQYFRLSSTEGVFVRSVEPNGPAAKAGLAPRDVIVAIDGKKSNSVDAFWSLFASHYVDEEVVLTVIRGGRKVDLKYKLTESPKR